MSLSFSTISRVVLPLLLVAGLSAPAWSQDAAPDGAQRVRFETTLGAFTIEVDPVRAPLTAASFLQYARDQHYDGTIFPRIVGNFVIQGGGYLPDGTEKPVRGGVPNESGNGLSNRRGTVALARTGDPHSGTSQFYVNVADNIALDPSPTRWGYAVFGRVVDGMDVIDRIASVATGSRVTFEEDTPLQPVVITTARIVGEAATPK